MEVKGIVIEKGKRDQNGHAVDLDSLDVRYVSPVITYHDISIPLGEIGTLYREGNQLMMDATMLDEYVDLYPCVAIKSYQDSGGDGSGLDQLVFVYLSSTPNQDKSIKTIKEQLKEREMKQLPKYQCHKVVKAFKIADIERADSKAGVIAILRPEDKDLPFVVVGKKYMDKHDPKVGGYYIRYVGGYESWSPAKEFEAGYTLMEENTDQCDLAPSQRKVIEEIKNDGDKFSGKSGIEEEVTEDDFMEALEALVQAMEMEKKLNANLSFSGLLQQIKNGNETIDVTKEITWPDYIDKAIEKGEVKFFNIELEVAMGEGKLPKLVWNKVPLPIIATEESVTKEILDEVSRKAPEVTSVGLMVSEVK